MVRYFPHASLPPIDQEIPRFSMNKCKRPEDRAPFAAVMESPIAAITSISPGFNSFILSGGLELLDPIFKSQRNGSPSGIFGWNF